MDKFFIQTNINVLKKNILLKKYFHLKNDKNYVGGFWIKIHFIFLSKHYMKSKKKFPQKISKYTQRQYYFLA
jgi:hypothetical protein